MSCFVPKDCRYVSKHYKLPFLPPVDINHSKCMVSLSEDQKEILDWIRGWMPLHYNDPRISCLDRPGKGSAHNVRKAIDFGAPIDPQTNKKNYSYLYYFFQAARSRLKNFPGRIFIYYNKNNPWNRHIHMDINYKKEPKFGIELGPGRLISYKSKSFERLMQNEVAKFYDQGYVDPSILPRPAQEFFSGISKNDLFALGGIALGIYLLYTYNKHWK